MKKISVKNAIFILIGIGIIGFSVIYFLTRKPEEISYKTIEASLGEIVQTVNETGTIKAITEIKPSFLASGKVQRINFKVGDNVKEGQLMAELDFASLVISKQEASANYDVATQNLNKILAGASKEEQNLAEAGVRQAESAYESLKNEMARVRSSMAEAVKQAEKNLKDLESSAADTPTTFEQAIISAENNLSNAKTSYGQAINNSRDSGLVALDDKISAANTTLDIVNRILFEKDLEDYLGVRNPPSVTTAKTTYAAATAAVSTANDRVLAARGSFNAELVYQAFNSTNSLLDLTVKTLNDTFSVLNNSVTADDVFTQYQIDTYKNSITAQLTIINSAESTVATHEQNYRNAINAYNSNIKSAEDALAQAKSAYTNALTSAKNALSTAKTNSEQQITSTETRVNSAKEALEVAIAQRDKALAGADSYDVSLNRAKIRQAQAAIDSITKQIENSQIKAPIDGQVTEVKYKVGEQAMSGQPVFSLLGNGDYEIEVLISEADINKVKTEDLALITLDAFGEDEIFNGSVFFIEPAETVIQDVIYYKVSIKFDQADSRIKPGMTANVTITTNKKSNVFSIPSRAIVDKGSEGSFVRLLVDNNVKEQKVTIGLRGDEGNVEIIDGLKLGDTIITQVIEK
jgi:multidrug efflux pump subunit AcrA (membrane-fusion protein)